MTFFIDKYINLLNFFRINKVNHIDNNFTFTNIFIEDLNFQINDYYELYFISKSFNKTKNNEHVVIFILNTILNRYIYENEVIYYKLKSKFIIFNKFNSKVVLYIKKYVSNSSFTNLLSNDFYTNFLPYNNARFINIDFSNLFNVLFIRKNKIFNKGRYSRNRQFYRTGVYWCLYINIIAIVGMYFWFYRFLINFSYIWWIILSSLFIFILSKSFNFNYFNLLKLNLSIYNDTKYLINICMYILNIFNKIILLILYNKVREYTIVYLLYYFKSLCNLFK